MCPRAVCWCDSVRVANYFDECKLFLNYFDIGQIWPRMRCMTPEQVIKHYGSQAAAADALNMTRAIISYWLKVKRIPPKTQAWIQLETHGALKAARK